MNYQFCSSHNKKEEIQMVVQYEITHQQKELLDRVFYRDKVMFGRDRLFAYMTEHYPEEELTQRQVGRYLMSQSIWQTSLKPNRKRKDTKSIVNSLTKTGYLQMDLKDSPLPTLRNQKYILVITDLYSKMVHISTIPNKSDIVVAAELERLIEESEYLQSATVMQNDNAFGAVVTNLLAEYGIRHLKERPAQPWTNRGAERFMSVISTFLTRTRDIGHSNYLTALPQLAEHYNNTKHSRTSMKPIDLQEAETDQQLNMKLKERTKNKRSPNENQFQVGDICRLRLSKADQLKSSAPFYSADVHRIIAIKQPKNPEMHPIRFKVLNIETDIPLEAF